MLHEPTKLSCKSEGCGMIALCKGKLTKRLRSANNEIVWFKNPTLLDQIVNTV